MKVRSWQNPHAPRAANGDEESEPIMTVPRERAEILDEKVENRWFNPFSWLNTTGGAFWQNAPRISTLPLQRTPPQNLPRASCASTQEFSNAKGLPALLRLDGDVLEPAVQRVLGLYRLTYDGIDGSAAWKHTELFPPCYLAFTDGTWFVQTEAAMRNSSGVGALCLDDADCVSPDTSATPGAWEAASDGGWRAEPKLRCTAVDATEQLPPPPRALLLVSDRGSGRNGRSVGGDDARGFDAVTADAEIMIMSSSSCLPIGPSASAPDRNVAACLGIYKLVEEGDTGLPALIHGRPVWRHARNADRILASTSDGGWVVQPLEQRGQDIGWLSLPSACEMPNLGSVPWEVSSGGEEHKGGAWRVRLDLSIFEASPLEVTSAPGLRLVGQLSSGPDGNAGVLDSAGAKAAFGVYRLVTGRRVNGRSVWRHSDQGRQHLWIGYSGKKWFVQTKDALGSSSGILCLHDRWDPDLSRAIWEAPSLPVTSKGGWVPQPLIRCLAMEASALPPTSAIRLRCASFSATACRTESRLPQADGSKPGRSGELDRGDRARSKISDLVGHYSLVPDCQLQGRPVWRQTVGSRTYSIAFTGSSWSVVNAEALHALLEDGRLPNAGIAGLDALRALESSALCRLVIEAPSPALGDDHVGGNSWLAPNGSTFMLPSPVAQISPSKTSRKAAPTGEAHLSGATNGAGGGRAGSGSRVGCGAHRFRGDLWSVVNGLDCVDASLLPSASDYDLFDDGFTSGTGERVCRPGRGEGLADTANGLCLFQDVLPESVTQGDLGNW